MKREPLASGNYAIFEASNEVTKALLMASTGMDDKIINHALDVAYKSYEKEFKKYSSTKDYRNSLERARQNGSQLLLDKYNMTPREKLSDILQSQFKFKAKANEGKELRKMEPAQVLEALRIELDTKRKEKPDTTKLNTREALHDAKVDHHLLGLKYDALMNFIKTARAGVANLGSDLVAENQKKGLANIQKFREMPVGETAKASVRDESFLGKVDSFEKKFQLDTISGTLNRSNINNFLIKTIPRVDEYAKFVIAAGKNSALTNQERMEVLQSLERVVSDTKMKIAKIEGAKFPDEEAYKEKDPRYQQFKALGDQLEACKQEYRAEIEKGASAIAEQAMKTAQEQLQAKAPSVESTQEQRQARVPPRPLQRQTSLTDEQYKKAVDEYEKKEQNEERASPAQVRRPSWTHQSSQAKLRAQTAVEENKDNQQSAVRLLSFSSGK